MKTNYGILYWEMNPPMKRKKFYTLKKLRSNNWLVFEIHSGQMDNIYPTKLRAYYAASVLNGMVKDYFYFGEINFKGDL